MVLYKMAHQTVAATYNVNMPNILFQYSRRLKKLLVKVTKAVSATPSGEEKIAEIVKNGGKANTYCKTVFRFYACKDF